MDTLREGSVPAVFGAWRSVGGGEMKDHEWIHEAFRNLKGKTIGVTGAAGFIGHRFETCSSGYGEAYMEMKFFFELEEAIFLMEKG